MSGSCKAHRDYESSAKYELWLNIALVVFAAIAIVVGVVFWLMGIWHQVPDLGDVTFGDGTKSDPRYVYTGWIIFALGVTAAFTRWALWMRDGDRW